MSLCSLQPMAEIHCKFLQKLEHLMNQNPHKIKGLKLGFLFTSKSREIQRSRLGFLVLKLHGFVSLNHHKIFQSKSKIKGMRFTEFFWPKHSAFACKKETDLPWVQKLEFSSSPLPPRLPKLKPSQEHSNSKLFYGFSLP